MARLATLFLVSPGSLAASLCISHIYRMATGLATCLLIIAIYALITWYPPDQPPLE